MCVGVSVCRCVLCVGVCVFVCRCVCRGVCVCVGVCVHGGEGCSKSNRQLQFQVRIKYLR